MTKAISNFFGYAGKLAIDFNESDKVSPYQVAINPYDLIFIYCDILENQIISNAEGRLLRITPVTAQKIDFGQIIHTEYQNSEYIPLSVKIINYLHFELRDLVGEKIRFESGPQPLMLRIHFRPIRRGLLEY